MKKIAVGDLGEFWYGDYKEPFEQLEGAVPGYPVGVLLKDDDGKLLCAYCGERYDNLGIHVAKIHGQTARSYKQETGLLQKSALVSERVRTAQIRRALTLKGAANTAGRMAELRTMRNEGWAKRRKGGLRSAERLNKTGRCKKQLLHVGQAILREDGRITEHAMRKRGIHKWAVTPYWGDFQTYKRACGDKNTSYRLWNRRELIESLRNLAAQLGRTPAMSDVRRYGLAAPATYSKQFGSYADACRAAGLEPNLPIPRSDDFDVQVLTAYATLGNQQRVADLLHVGSATVVRVMARYGYPFAFNYKGPGRREWAAEMARRLAGTESEAVAA